MVESNKMKLSFTNLDRIYVVFIAIMIKGQGNNKKIMIYSHQEDAALI